MIAKSVAARDAPFKIAASPHYALREDSTPISSLVAFIAAAFFEIAGCFAFWAWLRGGRPAWVLLPGAVSLVLFAVCLTRVDATYAGRAYAAYGGIYIASSLLWLRGVEGIVPDRWDLLGAGVAVLGALVVLLGPRP